MSENKKHSFQDLIDELRSETSSDFRRLLVALMLPVEDFYAHEFHVSLEGSHVIDENTIIEILITINNAELAKIKGAYKKSKSTYMNPKIKARERRTITTVVRTPGACMNSSQVLHVDRNLKFEQLQDNNNY